jgi:hypothetical protein
MRSLLCGILYDKVRILLPLNPCTRDLLSLAYYIADQLCHMPDCGQLNIRKIFSFSSVGFHPETDQLGNICTGFVHFHTTNPDFSKDGMKIVYCFTHDDLSHFKSLLNSFFYIISLFFCMPQKLNL